jgi:peptidoglycan hydrolase CwlO-like protein
MEDEEQKKIDDLYHKVWDLMDDIGSLQRRVLEIGEEMKEIVSSKVFE